MKFIGTVIINIYEKREEPCHLNELSERAVPYLSTVLVAFAVQLEISGSISNFEEPRDLSSSIDLRPQVLEHGSLGQQLLSGASSTRHAETEGVDVALLT